MMEGFFGTEYMPEIRKGDILFIEDSLKDACTIERSFSLLKLAGVFDKVSGIILGKHEKFDDNGTGRRPYEILKEVLGNRELPFLAEFDCCHIDKVSGIILGKHEKFDDNGTGRRPYEILKEVLGNRELPFLAEFDCCHTHPMLTMPLGCTVELDAEKKKVTLLEQPFACTANMEEL